MEILQENWRKVEEKKKEWLNFYKDNLEYKNVNICGKKFMNKNVEENLDSIEDLTN